ncbi:MAG: methionine adenosyltransferase [Sedimentisphaerales bacterium]|nr:methionine adenosyltransferase [Sedimentisphaerales bacterium]
MREYLFTSESVSEGHPDKIADQISDAVLDRCLSEDQQARVACETLVTGHKIILAGEVTSTVNIYEEAEELVRGVLQDIGYTDVSHGLDYRDCEVISLLRHQSPDIIRGVNRTDGQIGAGDQGSMFGYAVTETPQLMPLPVSLAHALMKRHDQVRRSGRLPWLRSDAKAQVTVRYCGERPICVETVILSTQHALDVTAEEVREGVIEMIIKATIPKRLRSNRIEYFVNPTGRFVIGGPEADTGLTGRKIIMDTYGGSCPHGGGAFSGKDPTKVDRSGSYMARYIAKNVVAADLARRCTVQISYVIGEPEPTSLMIDLHGTGNVPENYLEAAVHEKFALTPAGIIEMLDLLRPIYRQTATYGHFGREEPNFTWEKRDKVSDLAIL